MKFSPSLLILLCLGTRLLALDAAQLGTVTAKFSDPSGDVQYAARIELNRMIDDATAPGKGDAATAIRAIEEILSKPETSAEAKKYLLRALARVGTAESVAVVGAIFRGPDAMLREEARQVLESLAHPEASVILTKALADASEPRDQLALLDSLGIHRAEAAIPVIAPLISKPDMNVALAAVEALGKIGGSQSITTLGNLRSNAALVAPLKHAIDKALLFAGKDNPAVAKKIYQTTDSPDIKLAAFLLLSHGESSTDIIRDAMKSDDASLRLAALRRGLESNQPGLLEGGLDRPSDPFSPAERLIILGNLSHLKPVEFAVEIAVAALKSEDPAQRSAATEALGQLGGKSAFDAMLPLLDSGDPGFNRAVSQAISRIDAPEADKLLLAQIQGADSPEKRMAIKAAAFRTLPGVRPMLVEVIKTGDKETAQEAMKTLYSIGGIEELKVLCAAATAATAATDPQARASLNSFCKRLANRLATDEAKQLADALKTD